MFQIPPHYTIRGGACAASIEQGVLQRAFFPRGKAETILHFLQLTDTFLNVPVKLSFSYVIQSEARTFCFLEYLVKFCGESCELHSFLQGFHAVPEAERHQSVRRCAAQILHSLGYVHLGKA